jgi:hypothetical protein
MNNTYDFKVARPDIIKQLTVKDMLFAYYKCPQVDKVVHVLTHYNEIAFTLSGKKTLHHREKSWTLTDNTSVFVRRTHINLKNMILKVGKFLPSVSRMIFCDKYFGNTGNIYH